MDKNKTFTYSYSADKKEDISGILEKYLPKNEEESAAEKIRKLDAGVERKAIIFSLTIGIIGALVLGTGMSCTMIWADKVFVLGIIVGIIGIAIIASAYPLYRKIIKRERKKIAPQIIELSKKI